MSQIFVKDIFAELNRIAPVEMAMDFDNVGLLLGRTEREVSRVLIALDITDAVIDEAIALGAELIVAHHPIILAPLRRVTDEDPQGRRILKLARHDIAAICMHTNLDAAVGGVNDELAKAVGLSGETEILMPLGALDGVPYGLGCVGDLPVPISMPDFLEQVKRGVKTAGVRYYDAGRPVSRVAVMGGSGSDQLGDAIAHGCDTYVVGEAKYHAFLEARELGVNLIEADHFCTEDVVSAPLGRMLAQAFPGIAVRVSERHDQTVRFF